MPKPTDLCCNILPSSLSLAAKFEEPDDHLPTIELLQQAAQFGLPDYYTREEFQAMEIYLLKVFKWSVSHPTAAHFTDYYLHQSLKEEPSSSSSSSSWDRQVLELQMKQCCGFFLESALRGEQRDMENKHPQGCSIRPHMYSGNKIHVWVYPYEHYCCQHVCENPPSQDLCFLLLQRRSFFSTSLLSLLLQQSVLQGSAVSSTMPGAPSWKSWPLTHLKTSLLLSAVF